MEKDQQLKIGFIFLVFGTLAFFIAILFGILFPTVGAFTGFRVVVIPLFIAGLIMVYQVREEDVSADLRFRVKFMKRVAWILLVVMFVSFITVLVIFLPGLFT